jgi:hypothetical protein
MEELFEQSPKEAWWYEITLAKKRADPDVVAMPIELFASNLCIDGANLLPSDTKFNGV